MGKRVAHEGHPAALPAGAELRATAALMPSWASEITRLTPARPRRLSLRRKSTQKVSASEAPIAMPLSGNGPTTNGGPGFPAASRRPSALPATAMATATATMRPASRTFT